MPCCPLALVVVALGLVTAAAAEPSPDAILGEIEAIRLPEPDLARAKDRAYLDEFRKRRGEVRIHRAELIADLHRVDPENPRLVKLLPLRWRSLSGRMSGPDNNDGARDLSGELDAVLAHSRNPELRIEAAYVKAWIAGDPSDRMGAAPDFAAKLKAIDAFIAVAPRDPRGAELLYVLSVPARGDDARQILLYTRVVAEYPNSPQAKLARGGLQRLHSIGKPFDLRFEDAITGARVATGDLRGRILVVEFWSTTCVPCLSEMPRMKQIYHTYHDQGVDFLGINLNDPNLEGGVDTVRAFVRKNEVPWPQFYDGKGFEGDLATTWGVDSIPVVFLVGRDGKLVSVEAGASLDRLIRDQISRDARPTAPDAPQPR